MFNSMVQLESSMLDELHRAAQAGDTEQMKRLLRRGVTVSGETAQCSLVRQAATSGDQELLAMLLRRGMQLLADPAITTEALHNAAEDGDAELLGLLLEHGARRNVNDIIPGVKDTALHLAVRGNHMEAVQLLFDHCADVNALTSTRRCCYADDSFIFFVDENVTALHLVAEGGHFDIAKVVLSKGCAVNATTVHGYTALHLAVFENHDDIVRLLLQHGAKISLLTKEGESVVDIAKRRCHTKVLKTLEVHMMAVVISSSEFAHDEEEILWVTKYQKRILKRKRDGKKKSAKHRRVYTEEYAKDEASTVDSEKNLAHREGNETSVTAVVRGQEAQGQTVSYIHEQSSGAVNDKASCVPTSNTSLSDKVDDGTVTGGLVLLKVENQSDTAVFDVPFTHSITVEDEDAIPYPRSSDAVVSVSDSRTDCSSTDTLNSSWNSLEARPIIDGSVNFRSKKSRTSSVNRHSTGSMESPKTKCTPTKRDSFQKSVSFESENLHRSSPVYSVDSSIPFADEYADENESPNIRYPDKSDDEVFRELGDIQQDVSGQMLRSNVEARWTTDGDIEMVITERGNVMPTDSNGNYANSCHRYSENSGRVVNFQKTSDAADDECHYQDALSELMEPISQEDQQKFLNVPMDDSDEEEYLNDQTMMAAITLLQRKYAYESEDSDSDRGGESEEEDQQREIKEVNLAMRTIKDPLSGHQIGATKCPVHSEQREGKSTDQMVTQVHHDDAPPVGTQQQLFREGTHDTRYPFYTQAPAQNMRKPVDGIVTGVLVLHKAEEKTNLEVDRVPYTMTQETPIRQSTHAESTHRQVQLLSESNPIGHYGAQDNSSLIHMQDTAANKSRFEGVTGGLVLLNVERDTNLAVFRKPLRQKKQVSFADDSDEELECESKHETEQEFEPPHQHKVKCLTEHEAQYRFKDGGQLQAKPSYTQDTYVSNQKFLETQPRCQSEEQHLSQPRDHLNTIPSHNQELTEYGSHPKVITSYNKKPYLSNQGDQIGNVTGDLVVLQIEMSGTQQNEHESQYHIKIPHESELEDQQQDQTAQLIPQPTNSPEGTTALLQQIDEMGSMPKNHTNQQDKESVKQTQIQPSLEPEPQHYKDQISKSQLPATTDINRSREEHIKEELQKDSETMTPIKKKKKKSKDKDQRKSKKSKKKKADRDPDDATKMDQGALHEVIHIEQDVSISQYSGNRPTHVKLTNEKQLEEHNTSDPKSSIENQAITDGFIIIRSESQHTPEHEIEIDVQHQNQIEITPCPPQDPISNQMDKAVDNTVVGDLIPLNEENHQETQLEMTGKTEDETKLDRQFQLQLKNQFPTQLDDQHQIQHEIQLENHGKEDQAKPSSTSDLIFNAINEESGTVTEGLVLKLEHQELHMIVEDKDQVKQENGEVTGGLILLNMENEGQHKYLLQNNNASSDSTVAGYGVITKPNQAENQEIDSTRTWPSAKIDDIGKSDRHSSSEEDHIQNYAEKIEHIDSEGNVLYVEYIPLDPQNQTNDDSEKTNLGNLDSQNHNDIEQSVATENVTRDTLLSKNTIQKPVVNLHIGDTQPYTKDNEDTVKPDRADSKKNYDIKTTVMREVMLNETVAQKHQEAISVENTNAGYDADLNTMKIAGTDDQVNHDHENTEGTKTKNATDVILSENRTKNDSKDILPMNTDNMKFIDENYTDIHLRQFSPGVLKDDSQKSIRQPQDTEVHGEDNMVRVCYTNTGIVDSDVIQCRDNEQVKDEVPPIINAPRQEHELNVPVKPDAVTKMKTKKKKRKKKKPTDENIEDPSFINGTIDQQYQEKHIDRQPIHPVVSKDTTTICESKSTAIKQGINISEITTTLPALTGEGLSEEVNESVNRSNDEPNLEAQSDAYIKSTKVILKEESTTEISNHEQNVQSTYRDIINEMKLKFKQQKSFLDRNDDDGSTESKQGNINTVEAALSYMNKKYDYDSEEHLEEVQNTKDTGTSEPTVRLSTFEIPVRSTFTSRPTDIDSLLPYANVNAANIQYQREVEVQDTNVIAVSESTRLAMSETPVTTTVTPDNKQGNQELSQSSEHFQLTAMPDQQHQQYRKLSRTAADGEVRGMGYQLCTHDSDVPSRGKHRDPASNVSLEQEQNIVTTVSPDIVMTPVRTKKKKKKKPARPSKRTHSTDKEQQEPLQPQQIVVEITDNITTNIDNGTHSGLYESSRHFEEQMDYKLHLSYQTEEGTPQKHSGEIKDSFSTKSTKQEASDYQADLVTSISSPPTATKLLNSQEGDGKESSQNSQLVHHVSSADKEIKSIIAQQAQETPMSTQPRHQQMIEATPNIISPNMCVQNKYENVAVDVTSTSTSVSQDMKHLSSKEKIAHPNVIETVSSQEEYIIDAVADTDQSKIVAKIDQIIIKSLSNVKSKYNSQWCADDEESDEKYNDVHSMSGNSSYYSPTIKSSSRPAEIESVVPYVSVNTACVQKVPTLEPIQKQNTSKKGFTNVQQGEVPLVPQRFNDIISDSRKEDGLQIVQKKIRHPSVSSVNDQQVSSCNIEPRGINQTQEIEPTKQHLLEAVAARQSMVRVTNLDDYIGLYTSGQESVSVNQGSVANNSVEGTSNSSTPGHKKAAVTIVTVDNNEVSNDDKCSKLLVSKDKQLRGYDNGVAMSDPFVHSNTQTSSLTEQIQTQTTRFLPQQQGQDIMTPNKLYSHPDEQQEQIAAPLKQLFQAQLLQSKASDQLHSNSQQGWTDIDMPNAPTMLASDKQAQILISTPVKLQQHEGGNYHQQLPDGQTKMELQLLNEAEQTPRKKKKSKSKPKDKKKPNKSKKKTAEEETDILKSRDQGLCEEVILAGQGENIQQFEINSSGNMEISNEKVLSEGDVSSAGITVTSTPENEQTQTQKVPYLQNSKTISSRTNHQYPESTPPARQGFPIMPTEYKHRKISATDGDKNYKEDQEHNLSETKNIGTGPSFPGTILKPPVAHDTRERRKTSQGDEPFIPPRESAKKSKPLSSSDVYVLVKFDKGNLSNVGTVKKGESSEPLEGITQGTLDIDPGMASYITGPRARASQNASFQTDPNFLDTSEPTHFDFSGSMVTKSMDELDVECTPQGSASNREQQLRRSQSGGALHSAGKSGWGSSQRASRSSQHDMSGNILRANQTFDEGERIKSPRSSGGVQFNALDQVSVYHSQTHVGSRNYRQVTRAAVSHVPVPQPRSKKQEHTIPMQTSNQEGLNRINMPHPRRDTRQRRSVEGQLEDTPLPISKPRVVKQKPPKSPKWGDRTKEKTDHKFRLPTWGHTKTPTTRDQTKSHTRSEGYHQTTDQPMKSPSWVDIQTDHPSRSSTHSHVMIDTPQRVGNLQTTEGKMSQSWVDTRATNRSHRPPTQGVQSMQPSPVTSNMQGINQQMRSPVWTDIKTNDHHARTPTSDVKMDSRDKVKAAKHPVTSPSWLNIQTSDPQKRSSKHGNVALQTSQSLGNLEQTGQHMKSPSWINSQTRDHEPRSPTHQTVSVETSRSVSTIPMKDQQMKSPSWVDNERPDHQPLSTTHGRDPRELKTAQSASNLPITDHQMKSPSWMNVQQVPNRQRRFVQGSLQPETAQSVGDMQTANYTMLSPAWMNVPKRADQAYVPAQSDRRQPMVTPAQPRQTVPEQRPYHGPSGVAALFGSGSARHPQRSPASATEALVQQYHKQQFRGPPADLDQRHRERNPSAPSATAQHYHLLVSPSGSSNSRISDPTGLGGTLNQSIDTEIW